MIIGAFVVLCAALAFCFKKDYNRQTGFHIRAVCEKGFEVNRASVEINQLSKNGPTKVVLFDFFFNGPQQNCLGLKQHSTCLNCEDFCCNLGLSLID